MAKALFVCQRSGSFTSADHARLTAICKKLAPDNLRMPAEHRVHVGDGVGYAVMGFRPSVQCSPGGALLGKLFDGSPWADVESGTPDGSYAIFRSDQRAVEAVSDPAASRTIWYYHDDEQFVAATSQRAIVSFLRSFEFDRRVIPWVLSTGTPGPTLSWDKRIRRLPPDSIVRLDRQAWTLSLTERPVRFNLRPRSRQEQKELLREAIEKTLAWFDESTLDDWVLPLSGGYDSRAILCFLRKNAQASGKLRTITWGLRESLADKGNDAWVARELARQCGVSHQYVTTDVSSEPIDKIVDRFILCSEGRIDHIAGYMDGMEIWRTLAEDEGVHGVIRGDEGFGWVSVSSELTVRFSVGCATCGDFANLANVCEEFDLPPQEVPAELERQSGESLDAWRDRLYHVFRLPTILAGLTDVKLSYVEQLTPLVTRRILDRVREEPDELRVDKALFREIVDDVSPAIAYAKRGANADRRDLFKRDDVVELMRMRLANEHAAKLLGEPFMRYLLSGLRTAPRAGRIAKLKSAIKAHLPRSVKNRLWDTVAAPKVPGNVLAFRAYIMLRIHEVLTADCADAAEALQNH